MREELSINADNLEAYYLKANRRNRRAMSTLLRLADKQANRRKQYNELTLYRKYITQCVDLLNMVLIPVARGLSNG